MRVNVLVRGGRELIRAAAHRRRALSPAPDSRERALLRRASPRRTLAYAREQERRRQVAIRQLDRAARAAAAQQAPLQHAIVRAGGRLLAGSTLAGTITAVVPRRALRPLAARSDVQAIEPAPALVQLDDVASAASASGAPAWWAARHTGGRGGSDLPANLSVVQDPIYYAHPVLQGLTFERVPGNPTLPPNYTGNGHGTALISMAAAQGPTGCALCQPSDASEKGTAFGVSKVLDPDGAYSEFDWPLGLTYGRYRNDLGRFDYQPGAADPAQVLNYSRGGDVTFDDDTESQGWDARVDAHGVTAAIAAGNSGPGASTVNNPAIAYNVIAVGAYCCSGSASRTTDAVAGFSSRGPTVAGRKKPDLVAPGDADLADVLYNTTGSLWRYQTGTSFAAPQVAAAATVLAGAGIRDPKVVKALLIDSARQGRSSPSAAWGTQSGWQPDFGWGELDMDAAYSERLNFATGTVPADGARFFRATAQGPGDRATLVWNRRVSDCSIRRDACIYDNSGWRVYTLSNLDLSAYTSATGAPQATSSSAIDNVEQVRTTAAGDVIYKVAAGGVDGPGGEPFALAATRPLTELVTPQPAVALDTSAAAPVGPDRDVTLTATVGNPSPDLAAPGAQVTLALPAGVELAAGAATQPLGTLATNASTTVSWTVRGTSDGLKRLTATATASVYGTTLTGSASRDLAVDAAGPQVTLAAPAGASTNAALALAWSGSDPAGVAGYDVDVSLNGAPYAPWLAATTATAATYTGQPGNRYRFRVRARDGFGNASPYIVSGESRIDAPPPPPTPPPGVARRVARLKLTSASRRGRILRVRGSIDRRATGTLTLTWTARVRAHSYRVHGRSAARAGRFSATLKLPLRAAAARSAQLTVSYAGDAAFAPATRRVTLRRR